MVKELGQAQTSIGRVMVRYKGTVDDMNRPTLRLRTERLLRSVDLQPPGLPSGTLLIVQKVYALHGSAPLSSSASQQAQWAEHLRTQLQRLYRTAARPALHPVPSNATSVLFVDAAEMLACLTRDLLNGRAWQQWYWQQMLRRVPRTPQAPGSALATIWCEQAAFVPAMVGYLKLEEVRAAIALLSIAEVSQVIGALNRSFDLPSPVRTPAAITSERSPNPALDVLAPDVQAFEQTSEEYVPVLPPWQRWLSSLPVGILTPQAQYLFGLTATLHYAPTFARSTRFMAQAIAWLNAELYSRSSSENRENKPIAAQQARSVNSTSESLLAKGTMPPSPAQQARSANSTSKTPEKPMATLAPQLKADTPNDAIFGAAQPFPTEGVLTGLGGVLYLIHLLKWLNLPASWAELECLSSWGIVELLAYGLLGEMYEQYIDDPVWDVLAMLDGRESGTPIGADLPPQTSFRLPAKWLTRYGTTHPVWVAMMDGLRLYLVNEEDGYLVVDVPLEGRSVEEVIAAEVEAYRAQGVDVVGTRIHAQFIGPSGGAFFSTDENNRARAGGHKGPLLSQPPLPPLRDSHWWLERVIGFVRYLLVRILNDPAIDADTLQEALLCKRGWLIAGRTHVDLYMTMDQISIPIRRAGLDCDPSWVPDLGRIVLFHFGEET